MDLHGKRILIVKPSSLGDIIHALPVVHALKRYFPTCSIGWVVEQGFAPLLKRDTAVDAVYSIHITSTSNPDSGWFSYWQALIDTVQVLQKMRTAFRAHPYDVVFDLHASFRSGCLALMNPGGFRIGFGDARELNTYFQHQLINIPVKTIHAVEKNQLFSSFFGCETIAADYSLATSQEDERQVDNFLSQSGINKQSAFVYLNPTARWQTKFWISSNWSALCEKLLQVGIHPVFGGSVQDLAYIHEITSRINEGAFIAAGKLSLTESVALLKRAAAYVGLDTGPMHMAAMVGTPVVALFGPTHPERVGPYRVKREIIRNESLDCLCCRKRNCDHLSCMRGIEVDTVYEKVLSLIENIEEKDNLCESV